MPKSKPFHTGLRAALVLFTMALFVTTNLAATERVLHNFGRGRDGTTPTSLVFDTAGNLYGTTWNGGDYTCAGYGCGTVFEMTPKEGGGWTEKVLHSFGSGMDGAHPSSGLTFDAAGNLYGTANLGGTHGYGTVFEMTPNGSGGWTERVLHNFGISGTDGINPNGGLIWDAAGNLYGTTYQGGGIGNGTVFELTPSEGGKWTEKVLHNFGGYNGPNGCSPSSGLIWDAAGNLYGTTNSGGTRGAGTVFELTPKEGGGWTEKTLHNFGNGLDGQLPNGGVIFDASGNLYGTTYQGGDHLCDGFSGCGTVFEMTPEEGGGWREKVLHNLGNGKDGYWPLVGLILDAAGNLYGTTERGGNYRGADGLGCGTVFEVKPREGGGWTEKVLHNFGNGLDGFYPLSGLIFDAAGNFYGTTTNGGDYPCTGSGCGTVFEITPD